MSNVEKRYAVDVEELLAFDDLPQEEVEIPEWGGVTVIVRGLTGEERDAYEASLVRGRGKNAQVNLKNARAKLVAHSVRKPDGSRLFTEEHVAKLGQKSAAALQRIWTVARRLSGLQEEDIEELTGNSEADPSD